MKLSGGQSAVQCLEQLRESLHFLKLVLETVIPWTGRYQIISSCLYSELVALRFLFIYLFFKTLTLTCALTECTFGLHFFSLMLFIHYFILSFFHSFFLLLTCRLASSQKSPRIPLRGLTLRKLSMWIHLKVLANLEVLRILIFARDILLKLTLLNESHT